MAHPRLIALCANGRQAGKDTCANYIKEWCDAAGFSFERLAFADTGKRLIAISLDINPDDAASLDRFKLDGGLGVELHEGHGHHLTGRDYIINTLNGARTLFGDDFWTLQVLPPGWTPITDFTVITDLRFPGEANRVAECGGLVIQVQRTTAEGGQSEGELSPLYHDGQIKNNGTLDEFKTSVFTMMGQLTTVQR